MLGGSEFSLSDLMERLDSAVHQDELRQIFFEALARCGVKYCLALAIDWAADGKPHGSLIVQRSPIRLSYEQLIATHPNLIEMIVALAAKGEPAEIDTKSAEGLPKDWQDFIREHPFLPEINWCQFIPLFRAGELRGAVFYYAEQGLAPETTRWLIALTERGYDKLASTGVLPQACPFTTRQREVLRFCADGKSDWEIAKLLGISAATAHEHVESVKRKLGVRTRVQAVALATLNRWI